MEGAKRRVDEIVVARRLFEIEQRLFELLEEFRGLLTEDVGGIRVRSSQKLLCSGEELFLPKGLGDPAGRAGGLGLLFMPSSDSVVRNTIGTPR